MKTFLLLAATAMSLGANAQTFAFHEGHAFSSMSPDGKYLAEETNGVVGIYDATTDNYLTYGDEQSSYTLGLGNSMNTLGTLVGAMSGIQPAFWSAEKQDWVALPVGENDVLYGSIANGITADGKYICGSVAKGDYMTSEGTLNLVPVVWTMNDDGTYGMYETLPHPTTDFMGKVPQYATALTISDDGKTVAGQLMDYSGQYTFMLIYKKGEDGKWSYELPHPELIYDEEAIKNMPDGPGNPPVYPDITALMTEEASEAYSAALEKYYEDIDAYYAGLLDEFPQFPEATDYLTEEAKAAYQAELDRYYEEVNIYWEAVAAYEDALQQAVTGKSYSWNSINMSANGKYVATELTTKSQTGWGYGSVIPVRMELGADDVKVAELKGDDMLTTGVTNAGLVMAATPSFEYTRASVVFADANAEPQPLGDYVYARNEELAQKLDENLRFNVVVYEYDPDTYEETSYVVEDSLVTGTVRCNADATVFTGFLYDMWSGTYMPMSYVIDLGEADGISNAMLSGKEPEVNFEQGRLHVKGELKHVRLFDTAGRIVAEGASELNTRILPGCYIIRTEDSEGNVWAERVQVK